MNYENNSLTAWKERGKYGSTIIKSCKFCGKQFECSRTTPNKTYCSNDCLNAFYRDMKEKKHAQLAQIEKKCAYCSKTFIWDSKKPGQKYCSTECANTAYDKKMKITRTKKCTRCGKDFIRTGKKSAQKYCSVECAGITPKVVWTETRKCAYCGGAFEWCSSAPNKKYCGAECRYSATLFNQRKRVDAADEQLRNQVYLKVLDIVSKMDQSKGRTFGGTYIDYSIIGDISEKTREFVLERDGHECQVCKRKDSLQLHHLIKRRYGGNHKAENLITLCASCHHHIETGDIEHATTKCFKNAKRYYGEQESKESLDIDDLRDKLTLLFDKLKESSVGEDCDIMICLDEVLDLIDTKVYQP